MISPIVIRVAQMFPTGASGNPSMLCVYLGRVWQLILLAAPSYGEAPTSSYAECVQYFFKVYI